MMKKFLLVVFLFASSLFADKIQVQNFVERFYQTVLDRHSEEAGLNDWTSQLVAGTKAGADIAKGFIFSLEFTNRNTNNAQYLVILYKAFFDREPDIGGYNDWIAKLDSGISREKILDGFLYSTEFYNLCKVYGISPVDPVPTTGGSDATLTNGYQNVTSSNILPF